MPYTEPHENLPDEAKNRVLEANAYYWIKIERTPHWFPAKRLISCWYVVGKADALTERVTHVGNILVCPHE